MKKLLLFIFALFLWTGAWASKVIYLEPNIWDAGDADEHYAVHAWGGTSGAEWYNLVQVDGTTYYKAAIPDDCTNVLFTRASSQETAKDGWWNKTEDITLPSSVNAVAYIITSYTSGYGGNSAALYTGYYPNYARLGSASCSEHEGGRSANNAVDGNMNTLWGSNVNPEGEGRTKDNAWWQVDLGENFNGSYNYVVISWDNEPAKKFKIQTSTNGTDWTDVYVDDDETNEPAEKTCKYALSSTQTARYVKFQGVQRASPYGYGFYEFQIVNVQDPFVIASLQITANRIEVPVGETATFSVVGKDQVGVEMATSDLTWNSDDTTVGTVTDGVFTASKSGTARVTASNAAGTVTSNEVAMTVYSQTLASMSLQKYIFPAKTGAPAFSVYLYDTEGNEFDGDITFSWKDNNGPTGYVFHADNKTVEFGSAATAGTYTLQVTADEVTRSRDIVLVENGPEAPEADASDVLALYSDTYGATSVGGWATNWGWGYGYREEFSLSGNNCVHVHGLGSWAFPYVGNGDNLKDYKYLKFDVFAIDDVNGYVNIDKSTIANKAFSVTGGSWQTITIDITDIAASEAGGGPWVDIRFGANEDDNDRDVLIDNAYFMKEAAPDVEKPVMVSATLKSNTHNSATLTLNATDDSGKVMFHIEDATNGVDVTTNKVNSGDDYVYTLNDLNSNTSYSFTITALDASAKTSENNKVVNVTTDVAPAVVLLAEGTGTTGTDGGGQAGLEYSYRIVQTGGDVTATFTCTNSESYTGLSPIIWDNTSGFVETYGNTKKMTYPVGTEIRVACKWAYTGNMSVTPYINYVVKEAEANASIAAACNDAKETPTYYSTYSNRNAFVVPADVTVSEMGVDANGKLSIVAYNTDDVVPANTGVLISSSTAGTPEFKLTGEAGTSVLGANNRLRGTSDGIDAATMAANDENCLFYRLTMHNGTDLGFWWGAESGAAFAVAANKAYLAIPNGLAGAKDGFNIVGLDDEGETDGINKVNALVEAGVRYNLAGQRVGNDYKGIVIVNGHKVVIK